MERLTASDEWSDELRQNTPFAGVLDQDDRSRILEAFTGWWRTTHAS